MKLSYTLEGDKALMRDLKKILKKKTDQIKGETFAHGVDIRDQAKDNLKAHGRWDLGNAANSIQVNMENSGFTAKVEAEAPCSLALEFGARPHMPPVEALEGWAKRHGMDSAWPIALAISKRGIPATPFMIPAYESIKGDYYNALRKLLERT